MDTSEQPATLSKTIAKVLAEGGFESQEQAMRDLSLTIALTKVSRYERENETFKRKYNQSFIEFSQNVGENVEKEEFEEEDDLNDWEFAWRSLNLWQERAEMLRNA